MAMIFGIFLQGVGIVLGAVCVGIAGAQVGDPSLHRPFFGSLGWGGIPCIGLVVDETSCDLLPPHALDPIAVGLARSHIAVAARC